MNIDQTESATALLAEATESFIQRATTHPFLEQCRNFKATYRQLSNFLIQHAKYSAHFTRFLCALISNLECGDDVLRLAENLAEEIGVGGEGKVPHALLYRAMLSDLGIDIANEPTYPETQNLIDTMSMLCRHRDAASGLGALCLGAEAIVPAIYSAILEGLKGVGIDRSRLSFFLIHIECDDDHAETMYNIMQKMIHQDPSRGIMITNSADFALRSRLRLFDRLYVEGNDGVGK
jgi:pyrroloquinoline quinone (PQQ) biosynthesis protein C